MIDVWRYHWIRYYTILIQKAKFRYLTMLLNLLYDMILFWFVRKWFIIWRYYSICCDTIQYNFSSYCNYLKFDITTVLSTIWYDAIRYDLSEKWSWQGCRHIRGREFERVSLIPKSGWKGRQSVTLAKHRCLLSCDIGLNSRLSTSENLVWLKIKLSEL